jgi:hypothetical protein
MMRIGLSALVVSVCLVATVAMAAAPGRQDHIVVRTPELVVTRSGALETCALPGGGYHDFVLSEDRLSASFVLDGQALPAGSRQVAGKGLRRVSWEPGEKQTRVQVEFASAPQSTLLNAVPGTAGRPRTPQVLAGFIFDQPTETASSAPAVLGTRQPSQAGPGRQPGQYELPALPRAHYSDALVTLKTENADIMQVLFLMSQIGNVSIVIDPYYNDEPTGNQRAYKGAGDSGDSGGGSGFQNGTGSTPIVPQNGTGFVTLNFNAVPFDQALDLLLETAGLVKADIYPRG